MKFNKITTFSSFTGDLLFTVKSILQHIGVQVAQFSVLSCAQIISLKKEFQCCTTCSVSCEVVNCLESRLDEEQSKEFHEYFEMTSAIKSMHTRSPLMERKSDNNGQLREAIKGLINRPFISNPMTNKKEKGQVFILWMQ